MDIHTNKTTEDKSRAVANSFTEKQAKNTDTFQFTDNRPETIAQRKLNSINSNPLSSYYAQPIQRQILGEGGFVKNLKLAEKHARFDSSLGFTPPTVNSHQIGRASDVVDAFKGKDQLINVAQTGDAEFTARVDEVPQNHMGHIMYLPEMGPWIKDDAKKQDVLAMMGTADNGRNVTDKINLEITGRGGHEQLSKEVEKHETVHARDNDSIRDAVFKPWDLKLAALKKGNTLFTGATAEAATGKLWVAVGGSLLEKAQEANGAWGHASDAFHDHEQGKTRMDNDKSKVSDDQKKAVITYYLTV